MKHINTQNQEDTTDLLKEASDEGMKPNFEGPKVWAVICSVIAAAFFLPITSDGLALYDCLDADLRSLALPFFTERLYEAWDNRKKGS